MIKIIEKKWFYIVILLTFFYASACFAVVRGALCLKKNRPRYDVVHLGTVMDLFHHWVNVMPFVSNHMLSAMSIEDILRVYPYGIRVLTPVKKELKNKLQRLTHDSYFVQQQTVSKWKMRNLTVQVIDQLHYTHLLWFLSKVYEIQLWHNRPFIRHCPPFLKQIFPNPHAHSLHSQLVSWHVLEHYSPEFYQRMLVQHPLWRTLGYKNMAVVLYKIQNWIHHSFEVTHQINMMALNACGVVLSHNAFYFVNQMITLQYLSHAVRGLYFQHIGVELPYYQKIAVQSLRIR